ncbi:DUF4402 domain-containing protein [Sphingomicrobium nitratireducens]|uniref:DUF4402 domain-containing protein n=1 Tax=Sphingomicrobium nitratireducens TaxID=2964666 RepID=UPI002240D172|nr:DUF4402 domain-containing protein [Sphingomicrobium nitratireducens]
MTKGWLAPIGATLVAILASVALPAAGNAQCRLCSSPVTTPNQSESEQQLVELQVESQLDFAQLIVLDSGEGSATLAADGERRVSGSVTAISSRAMLGSVTIHGEPGRRVSIDMPARIELHSVDGRRIVLEDISADFSDFPALGGDGSFQFNFGGRLIVEGGLEGDFRGDIPISVEYL